MARNFIENYYRRKCELQGMESRIIEKPTNLLTNPLFLTRKLRITTGHKLRFIKVPECSPYPEHYRSDHDARNDSKYGPPNTIVNGNRIHSDWTVERTKKGQEERGGRRAGRSRGCLVFYFEKESYYRKFTLSLFPREFENYQ